MKNRSPQKKARALPNLQANNDLAENSKSGGYNFEMYCIQVPGGLVDGTTLGRTTRLHASWADHMPSVHYVLNAGEDLQAKQPKVC